jgi:transposase
MNEVSLIGVALAKNVFQAHGARADGSVAFRTKVPRARRLDCFSAAPQCMVAMAACAGAPHWAREIAALGRAVRLMASIDGKPFGKRQKNDRADAEAIAEAALRPTMRFVAVKSVNRRGYRRRSAR